MNVLTPSDLCVQKLSQFLDTQYVLYFIKYVPEKKSVAPLQYSNACNITEICVAMHIMVVVKHMFSTVHNAALSCDKSKALYKHMAVQALYISAAPLVYV